MRTGKRSIALGVAPAVAAAALASFWAPRAEAGGVQFTNVTAAAGINYVQWSNPTQFPFAPLRDIPFESGGAAAGDFDGDGWTDLFVTRYDGSPILYRNLHNGAFADVTPASLKVTDSTGAPVPLNGAVWGDVNNDGHPDLFVQSTNYTRHFLFMGDGRGHFTEEAVDRGVAHDFGAQRYGMSPALGDYNRDGYLDLLTTEWSYDTTGTRGTQLFKNNGASNPGHFTNVTQAAGVVHPSLAGGGRPLSFAGRFTDLDRDGYPDLAITSDFGTSQILWNKHDGTFADGTIAAGVNTSGSEMGSTVVDYNGDGKPDWFVSAITNTGGNRLYKNLGNRTFAEVSVPAGVRDGGWGWGSAFVDYDLDGKPDLIHTNGMPFYDKAYFNDQTRVYHNEGNGTFVEVATGVGVTDTGMGKGLLTFDYDNDGDPDVFIVNNSGQPILYRNDGGNANHWLKVRPVGGAGSGVAGAVTNRDGYGVLVTLIDSSLARPLTLEIDGGSNYLGQSDPTAIFGLGPDFTGTIDTVQVQWPGGVLQEFHNVAPDQLLVPLEIDAVPEPGVVAGVMVAVVAGLGRRTRRTRRA
jgi:hypothetical protein